MFLVSTFTNNTLATTQGFAFRAEALTYFEEQRVALSLMEQPIAPAVKQRDGLERKAVSFGGTRVLWLQRCAELAR
jgi:hypothetical protein